MVFHPACTILFNIRKRNIGRNVYNKTFTHNVHNYNNYDENPECDKSQQCRRNVIHCTQKNI